LPEVSLVSILDADKEGFLRSTTSLIQTIGRAARNVSGEVHMYADKITDSMARAIDETNRRRQKQVDYNTAHGVDPQPLRKKIADITDSILREEQDTAKLLEQSKSKRGKDNKQIIGARSKPNQNASYDELLALVVDLDQQMKSAAAELKFELAARLRDEISELKYTIRQIDKV
jgi:excinuclease ABC subunit B